MLYLHLYICNRSEIFPSFWANFILRLGNVFRDGLYCHVARLATTTIGSGYLVSYPCHVTNDVFNVEPAACNQESALNDHPLASFARKTGARKLVRASLVKRRARERPEKRIRGYTSTRRAGKRDHRYY